MHIWPFHEMGKSLLNDLPILQNWQLSFLFHEICKFFAYFMRWPVTWIGRTHVMYILPIHVFGCNKRPGPKRITVFNEILSFVTHDSSGGEETFVSPPNI